MFYDWYHKGNVYFSIVPVGLFFWLIVWLFRKLPSPRGRRKRSVVPSVSSSPRVDPQSRRVASILSSLPSHEPKPFRSKYDFCRDWPALVSACLGDEQKAHRLVEYEARRGSTASPDTLVTYALLSLRSDRR